MKINLNTIYSNKFISAGKTPVLKTETLNLGDVKMSLSYIMGSASQYIGAVQSLFLHHRQDLAVLYNSLGLTTALGTDVP